MYICYCEFHHKQLMYLGLQNIDYNRSNSILQVRNCFRAYNGRILVARLAWYVLFTFS